MVYFWRRRSGQTFRLTSDRLRENMALWGKNSTISPCLVDRYENKTIWGETRIQSSEKTWRKTQRTKRLFTPARKSPSEISHPVCSAYRSVFQTELETLGTALESLMYCFAPHEGASQDCVSLPPPSGASVTVRSRRARDNTALSVVRESARDGFAHAPIEEFHRQHNLQLHLPNTATFLLWNSSGMILTTLSAQIHHALSNYSALSLTLYFKKRVTGLVVTPLC